MELIRTQKYESFSLGPLIAYILARPERNGQCTGLLAGKRHRMDDRLIQERLRELYV